MNAMWIKRGFSVVAVAGVAVVMAAPQAEAASATSAAFIVSVDVAAACSITGAALTFPLITLGQLPDVTASSNVHVTCPGTTALAPLPVQLSMTAAGGFVMANGLSTLSYVLCQDAGNPCVTPYLPTGVVAPKVYSIDSAGGGQDIPFYGVLPGNQATATVTGVHQQNVTATVTF